MRPYDNKNAIHLTCGIYLKWHLKGHCSLKCYIRKEEKWEIKEQACKHLGKRQQDKSEEKKGKYIIKQEKLINWKQKHTTEDKESQKLII